VSCALAIVAPFHTFLLAYAILGPLHYLTEISWLHDRDYFAPRRWVIVAGVAMAVLLYGFVMKTSPVYEIGFVWFAFATAAIAVFVRSSVNVVAMSLIAGAAIAFSSSTRSYAIAAYLLVTIVHVFLFTAVFILFGAIKSHNPFIVNDIVFARSFGVDVMAMNNYGCSLVWGHPQGPTGLRAIIELIEELVLRGGGLGLFHGCAAGDTAMSVVISVEDAR